MKTISQKMISTTLLALALILGGCQYETDDSPLVTTSFPAQAYSELEVSNAIQATMSDTAQRIYLTCSEAVKERVVVQYDDEKLRLYTRRITVHTQPIRVILPTNLRINDIDLSGASSFSYDGALQANNLSIDISGASHLTVGMETNECDIELSGASQASLHGTTNKLDLEMSGASQLEASNLKATHVEAEMSGACQADIYCTTSLNASASGASHLRYHGNPSVRINTSGGSSVEQQ